MKKTLFFLVFVITLFSCKNEENNKEIKEEENKIEVDDTFKVSLNVLVKKDDDFQIYYTENKGETFTEEKSIWVAVKGNDNLQKIVFEMPKDVLPNLVRFDFGVNDNQEDILLSSIEMEYFGKKFIIEKEMLSAYFRPLELTQIDFNTGILSPTIQDGKRVESVLHPHETVLEPEIQKLIQ